MPLLAPLEDFKPADLPERTQSFWRMAGPGAILVGLSIGAGEIVVWPRAVAAYGAGMIWAAGVGIFLQTWINLEIARWTIATGETVYTGYARVWRGFAPLFLLLTVLGWIAPGWGQASGLALKALLLTPDYGTGPEATGLAWLLGTQTFWTAASFAGVALLLFGPKLVYRSVEKTVEALVLAITVGLVAVALAVGTLETWKELGAGLVNFGYKHPDVPFKKFFIWLVFAGAGGTANLFYTFYLRDKNIGMGARLPALTNALRGRQETIPATGYRFEDNAANRARWRAWFSYIRTDQLVFFFALNSFTIILFIFGALAVLHPRGIVPEENRLIYDQAVILGEVWGGTGRTIFLLVGMATLFSTQLALVDGVARSMADIVYTNFAAARRRELGWWYLAIAGSWMAAGVALTAVMEWREISNLTFLLNAAYMGGFAMAVYVPLTLYLNLKHLPRCARPGPLCIAMMLCATLVYTGFAVYCLVTEFTG
ncbi:MAG: Nramp family divalent metal transporter [Planctomycetota bacterium]|nr:Nramp family divalent metal transporter [Planctomycetota bacterium]